MQAEDRLVRSQAIQSVRMAHDIKGHSYVYAGSIKDNFCGRRPDHWHFGMRAAVPGIL